MRSISKRWVARIGAVALVATGVGVVAATPAQAFVPFTSSMTVGPGATESFTKSCGSRDVVTSGGALATTPLVLVWESYPSSNHDWTVTATNTSNFTETILIRVVCAVGSLASYEIQPTFANPATGTVGTPVAGCQGGRTAMGGGWKLANANFRLIASRPTGSSNQWQVLARNNNNGAAGMFAYATCVGNIGARHLELLPSVTVAPGASTSFLQRCSGVRFNSGGGFSVGDTFGVNLVTASLPIFDVSTSADEWKFNIRNFDTMSHTVDVGLVCYD